MVRVKDSPFWKYVDQLPDGSWKCKYCSLAKKGRPNRIIAHLAKVEGRGIVTCSGAVPDDVKAEAMKAINKEAPDMQQQQIEETAHQDDQGIGSENNPNVLPSSDNNLLPDFQPGDQYVPEEASHLFVSEGSLIPFEIGEFNPAMLHAQFQQPDPLPNSSFPQQNEVNTIISTPQDLHRQNMNGLGVNMHSVSICTEFDQSLLTLKRKLNYLSNQKEEREEELYQWSKKLKNQKQEKEEELYQWSKKVRTMKGVYQRIYASRSEGNHPSLEQLNEVKELINQVEELGNLHMSEKETSSSARSSKAPPLLTSKLFGRDFEVSKIRDSLVSDDILRISVYGMGGVGKTEIMMNVYNELLNDEAFDNVFWVTMPKNFNVYELQSAIGNAVHLEELSNEKDEKIRAAMLYKFFTLGKKYVVILDGLWRLFNYNDAGIPSKCNGLKLVITCQSLHVSRGMFCQKEIKISTIQNVRPSEEDWDWELFMHELGEETKLPTEVEEIARDIVDSCEGLPLYIKAAATRLRGVAAVQEWSDMLEKMNDPKQRFHTLKGQVFNQLKLSYELLNDHELQQCLIFCALHCGKKAYPKLRAMKKVLVDVGVTDQRNSREKLYRAHNNLKELEKACLLSIVAAAAAAEEEEEEEEEVIQMHVSIIDMALHAVADTNLFIVFSNIKFLDLSKSKIEELPNFISDLVKLTALVLRGCSKLRHIPNIGKLASLRHLDLFECSELKDLPDGLEDLVNLEELSLRLTGIVKIPKGVLRNLRKLQYLYSYFVEVEELKGLVMLKKLSCMFSTLKELAKFDDSFHEKGHANIEYAIVVASEKLRLEEIHELAEEYFKVDKRVVVLFECEDEEREVIVPPKSIQELHIFINRSQRIIWPDCFGQENLEKLCILGCQNLKYVMEPEANTRYSFSKLEEISIGSCNGLEEIIAASFLLHPNAFSCLKSLSVRSCKKMKRLLNHDMLRHLSKLQSIVVINCENMDELISTSNGCTTDFCATTPLPKLQLRTLSLLSLPELRSIGAVALASPIETIKVLECPKLKKIPLQMEPRADGGLIPPSSLREIRVVEDEKEWWNSLEWESLEAKDALRPCRLLDWWC